MYHNNMLFMLHCRLTDWMIQLMLQGSWRSTAAIFL